MDERPEDLIDHQAAPIDAPMVAAPPVVAPPPEIEPAPHDPPEPVPAPAAKVSAEHAVEPHPEQPVSQPAFAAATNGNGHVDGMPGGCTPAQMRRFIKSRPWIPMHELRRRFGINGHEDDVTPVAVGPRTLFVGLPEREGRMLGELLRGGDVGYELSVDPDTPIVIGVFPMRPVARP